MYVHVHYLVHYFDKVVLMTRQIFKTNGCVVVKALFFVQQCSHNLRTFKPRIYTVFQKSDAKIQITITRAYLIRIKYPLSGFNYHLSDVNVANFNKPHRTVSEQQLF